MNHPHRGVNYGSYYDEFITYIHSGRGFGKRRILEKQTEAQAGIKEMQEAMEAFDILLHGAQTAAEQIGNYTKVRSERETVLHRKAKERRAKRKRGGHK